MKNIGMLLKIYYSEFRDKSVSFTSSELPRVCLVGGAR